MKKFIGIIGLLLFFKDGWAQNTNLDYKNAFKIYNLTTFEKYSKYRGDTTAYSFRYTTTTLQILHPTIAFQWKTKKNNFREIELTNFMLSKTGTQTEIVIDSTGIAQMVSRNDLIATLISVRYEYTLNFNKSKDKKLVPSLGFSINPYFRQNTYTPIISTSYKTVERYFGASAFVIPRLTYYLSSKLFIDINIPLSFSDIYCLTDKEENPAIPAKQQTITTYNFELFPKIFSGRLGVGLKL